jgi:hypothetical protein
LGRIGAALSSVGSFIGAGSDNADCLAAPTGTSAAQAKSMMHCAATACSCCLGPANRRPTLCRGRTAYLVVPGALRSLARCLSRALPIRANGLAQHTRPTLWGLMKATRHGANRLIARYARLDLSRFCEAMARAWIFSPALPPPSVSEFRRGFNGGGCPGQIGNRGR